MGAPLLHVRNLRTEFRTPAGILRAVNGVDLSLHSGQTLAIVGESGSGKSVTSMSLMRLIPEEIGASAGEVLFEGQDLMQLDEAALRKVRGNRIAMIFQDPMSSLNPVLTVGYQIGEALRLHQGLSRAAAEARAVEMLAKVGIPSPEQRVHDYPHQLSGGMRQRVMIAMALCCAPKLLIADEPTTALDVTIQAQILALLRDLRESTGTAVILITHDLGVVAESADQVMVMYAGRKLEEAPVGALFARPAHPYTRGLIAAVPRRGQDRGSRLAEIPGQVPLLSAPLTGCAFAGRCAFATDVCRTWAPGLRPVGRDHQVACHFPLTEVYP